MTSGRRLAGAAVAAVLAGGGILVGATAASATDSLSVNVQEYGLTLPAGVPGPSAKTLHIKVEHDLDGHVPSATLTVDVSGLAGVADVTWPKECTVSGTIGTCTITHVEDFGQPPTWLGLGLSAAAGAKDGAKGTIGLKATAPGLNSYTTSADVSVGSGADMVIQQLGEVTHAKIGSTLTAPIRWANTGNETAPSTVLTLQTIAGLEFTHRYSNCRYSKPDGPLAWVTASCTIDTPLAPGDALELDPQVALHVTKEAYYTLMTAQVLPPGQQTDATRAAKSGTLGTGPRLTAKKIPASTVTAHVTDINPSDSYTEFQVHADSHAHFSAIGADVKGDKGQTVPLTVGMRNNGPALIFDRSGGDGVDTLVVTLPAGTTVTSVPDGCHLVQKGGVKGHGPFECYDPASYVQGPHYKATWTFKVQLDQQLKNARGTAALSNIRHDLGGEPVTFPWDTSTKGYVAPIVINGPAAGSTADTNNPGTDGSDGQSLAATGGGGHSGLIIGGAVVAVVGGAGVLFFSRRRKTA